MRIRCFHQAGLDTRPAPPADCKASSLRTVFTAGLIATLLLLNPLTVSPVFSWFDKGHRIVGLIAAAELSAEARTAVERILPQGTTLADAAVWPDHEGRSLRDFDPLHYVSITDGASGYDRTRDCPERNCMVEALRWFSAVLADRNSPIAMRRLALRYVAHLVGDMHQPLHAGRAKDRGGVDFQVSYQGATTNLHYFWDKNIVDLEPGDEQEIAHRLMANITAKERLEWQAGGPERWTDESLSLVRSHAYDTEPGAEVSEAYVEKARPVVRTRLAQAGVRLGWLLNNAFR